jgi:cell division protein FtsL
MQEGIMNYPRFAKYAAIATLTLVVLGGVACAGSTQSSTGSDGAASTESAAQTQEHDEGLAAVDKALGRSGTNAPLIAGEAPVAPKPSSPSGGGIASPPSPPTTAPADAGANTADRKIVQTAALKLQVKNVGDSYGDVTRIATTAGGFVSTSNVSNAGDSQIATLSLRVPTARYQQVLGNLRALGVKIDNETSNANDVTEEYSDLASRQRNLEAAETQLLTLLANAKTVAEVLQVQDRLTTVRGQIEQAKGRIQLLDKLSDLATISITLRPVPGATQTTHATSLRAQADEAWASSIDFLGTIAGGLLTVVVFSWWLPIVAVPAVVIGKRLSRHATPTPATE